MNEIEKKVLDFLKTGMVYSDEAIMKNLGINNLELEDIYNSLTEQGYLESYSDFLKKDQDYGLDGLKIESGGCAGKKCNSCSSCNEDKVGCSSEDDEIDFSKIRVLTEKAFVIES